ncbi:MAG TPA: hypothetical protein VKT28_13565 [Puia sp.]|nr:hypothetical protein [Puia sp.]
MNARSIKGNSPEEIKTALRESMTNGFIPTLAFVFIKNEIQGMRKAFDVLMAGFFTYGEFGRTKNGDNEFHNNTCWVALKEK